MLTLPKLQHDVVLAPLTTYKIGGPADFFLEATTQDELAEAIRSARAEHIPYFILGTGANILMGDKGFRGLVIHNQAAHHQFDGHQLTAESGATIADLIAACIEHKLSGLEHFAGIPSSVGGAMRQNLHFLAPDRKSTLYIGDIVASAKILDETGKIQTVDQDYFNFGYDDSILHHNQTAVLEVTFELAPKDSELITEQVASNMAWRTSKQPQLWEFPSCGSVFKKIEGVGSGRLIDQAGLKGKQIGGIKVSDKHANYLVNMGSGTAKDVRDLITLIQTEVKKTSGYDIEPEIGFVGEF